MKKKYFILINMMLLLLINTIVFAQPNNKWDNEKYIITKVSQLNFTIEMGVIF
jgi:hypothetical protein